MLRRLMDTWRKVAHAVRAVTRIASVLLGAQAPNHDVVCPQCHGEGDLSRPPAGEGWIQGQFDPCPTCRGKGSVIEVATFSVEASYDELGDARTVEDDIASLPAARKLARRTLREASLTRVRRADRKVMYEFRRKRPLRRNF